MISFHPFSLFPSHGKLDPVARWVEATEPTIRTLAGEEDQYEHVSPKWMVFYKGKPYKNSFDLGVPLFLFWKHPYII